MIEPSKIFPTESFDPLHDKRIFPRERHPFFIYIWAAIIGVTSSLSAVAFIKCYKMLSRLIYWSKSSDFQFISSQTPHWYFFITFPLGGLLVGLLLYYLLPFHGHGHGLSNLKFSYQKNTYISLRDGLLFAFACIFSIALGTSVGQIIPIIFFASFITSWICFLFKIRGHYYRILLACSVAASLSASLHSSIAGIFFVIEVIAFSLTILETFPIMISVAIGVIIRHFFPALIHNYIVYPIIKFPMIHVLPSLILGICCGLLAIFYIWALTSIIQGFYRVKKIPKWIWPGVAGLALACINMVYPQALGLGLNVITESLVHPFTINLLFFILLAKFLAVFLSLGFGFAGGILSPTLFLGFMMGSLFGGILYSLYPSQIYAPQIYALIGCAAFTAPVIGAPITLTVLAFEITGSISTTLIAFIAIMFSIFINKYFKVKSFFETQYRFIYYE